ncbi:hypothetical protein [Mycolicibacterium setense]|uniref:hypothetical protein n=1 Tax=Mycolicibacterium setense TaxID=431269 RepID=UPI0005733D40|nr:hypothetical protein [Mycolicibacterium setense]KHO21817.1 hypothetical protein QQ25_15080 [Mycolicibacterium setense]MCV7114014.1 hypothetical protein [Mycolicibacterium setense]
MTKTAGEALRERLDTALAERGLGWEWTALDLEVIDSACRHADRAEQLQRVYDENLAGESPSVSALARLAAECRHHERRVLEMVSQLAAPEDVPKSARHQAAVNSRWNRKRQRDAARVESRPIRAVE